MIFKENILMYSLKSNLISRVMLTAGIGICSMIGDRGLKYGTTPLARAIFDNLTHAIVGGLTWTLVLNLSKKSLIQNLTSIFLCFCLSSFVDVDHFLTAHSWKLSDATHLPKRPFLHCTTVPIMMWLVLILSSNVFNYPKLGYYSWIILASFLSHHLRDATRRGLWFCPVGSTQPIPYYLYLSLCMALPYTLHWCMPVYYSSMRSNVTMFEIL